MKLKWWIAGYAIALALVVLSPLASSSPDGLERVAGDKAFLEKAEEAPYEIVPDYAFPGIENEAIATIAAGVVGVTTVFLVVGGGAYLVQRASAKRCAG